MLVFESVGTKPDKLSTFSSAAAILVASAAIGVTPFGSVTV